MIEEFKDTLKRLKNILNEIKNLKLFREQEINETKNETKRKLNMLDNELDDILEKLDADLTTLITICKFFEKTLWFRVRRKRKTIKNSSQKNNKWNKKKKLKRLKEEAEINKDELLDDLVEGQNKISKLLTDFGYEKHDTLNDMTVSESKLIKLKISPEKIDRIKNLVLSS